MLDTFLAQHTYTKPYIVGVRLYEVPEGINPSYVNDIICGAVEHRMAENYDHAWRGVDRKFPHAVGIRRYTSPTDYLPSLKEPFEMERLFTDPNRLEPVIVYSERVVDDIILPPHTIILPKKNII